MSNAREITLAQMKRQSFSIQEIFDLLCHADNEQLLNYMETRSSAPSLDFLKSAAEGQKSSKKPEFTADNSKSASTQGARRFGETVGISPGTDAFPRSLNLRK